MFVDSQIDSYLVNQMQVKLIKKLQRDGAVSEELLAKCKDIAVAMAKYHLYAEVENSTNS